MKHVRYLNQPHSVCWDPDLLGDNIVYIDENPGPMCKDCVQLLIAYNRSSEYLDMVLVSSLYNVSVEQVQERKTNPFRRGVILASAFWMVVILFIVNMGVIR